MWRDITLVKDAFAKNIRYHVGAGDKIMFWLDNWIGETVGFPIP